MFNLKQKFYSIERLTKAICETNNKGDKYKEVTKAHCGAWRKNKALYEKAKELLDSQDKRSLYELGWIIYTIKKNWEKQEFKEIDIRYKECLIDFLEECMDFVFSKILSEISLSNDD